MKRVVFGLMAVVLLVVAVAGAIFVFFPKEKIAAELKKQVQQTTGRTLDFGDTSVTFWPALGLSASNVSLSNPPGFGDTPFLTAKKIVVAVAVAPLLKGDVDVNRLMLDTPRISLIAPKDKPPNWSFPPVVQPASDTAAKPAKLKSLRLDNTEIEHGSLMFAGANGAPLELSDINASLALPSLDAPARIKGDALYRKERVTLDLSAAKPRALMEQGVSPVTLVLQAKPIKALFKGDFNAATGGLAGTIDTSGPSARKLVAWLAAPLPPGGGFSAFAVKSSVAVNGPVTTLTKGTFRLDALNAGGDLTFTSAPSGRLAVRGALRLPVLDVNPYLPATALATTAAAAGAANAPPPPAAGVNTAAAWDSKPLDLAGLRATDADLALTVADLRFQKLQFTNGQVHFKLNSGVADATLSRVSLYGGAGTGRLVLDASHALPKLRTELDVSGVNALPLLTAAIGFDKIEGKGTLKTVLAGEGRSQADIMRTLSGTLSFAFNDGAYRGVNLAQVARTVQTALTGGTTGSAAKTDFAEFAADFAVAGGVANTQNLRLLNPFVRLDGQGDLNIGAQTIDMKLAPRAVRAIEGQGGDAAVKGIGVPFRVTGPWSKPAFRPDLAGLAQAQLTRALGGKSIGDALGGLIGGKKKDGQPSTNPLDRLLPNR